MITEKQGFSINGYMAFFVVLPILQIAFGFMFVSGYLQPLAAILFILVLVCWAGFLWFNLIKAR